MNQRITYVFGKPSLDHRLHTALDLRLCVLRLVPFMGSALELERWQQQSSGFYASSLQFPVKMPA